jgi:hypothetical protein
MRRGQPMRLRPQHIGQAHAQRQHAADVAEAPAPSAHLAHALGRGQLGQEGARERFAVGVEGVGDDDQRHRQGHTGCTAREARRHGERRGAQHATDGREDQHALLGRMLVGPCADGGHREHHDGIGDAEGRSPREGGPRCPLGDATHEVGGEHRGDDDRGVARVGEVVHRPAEDFALAHARAQRGGWKQGHAAYFLAGAGLLVALSAGGADGGRRHGRHRCRRHPSRRCRAGACRFRASSPARRSGR